MKKEAIFLVMVIVAILAMIILLNSPVFHRWNAKRIGDIKESYIKQDANIRVQSYEWFYSMYEEIQATQRKVIIAQGTPEEKGIKMVLSSMIAEYNSKSKMTSTRAQWKANDLPYEIENNIK